MIIVHIGGGFGNQLFTYAFGYALAKKRGEELIIDTAVQDAKWFFRDPLLMELNLSYSKRVTYKIGRSFIDRLLLNKLRYRKAIGRQTIEINEKLEDKGKYNAKYLEVDEPCVYMRGDWQSELYFKSIESEIREKYTFKQPLSDAAVKIYHEIISEPNSVTIHCRRGDYVDLGICISETYYIKAMTEIMHRISNPVFFCFSDDLDWAQQAFANTGMNIKYPTYRSMNKDIEDFRLLSAGMNQIVSNSSYSWWAAYLNCNISKLVVCPCMPWGIWTDEFWPSEWVRIPCQ